MNYSKCYAAAAAFLLFAAPFAAAGPIAEENGRSYYVAASGSDANNGLSEQNAFKTLAKAVETASRGSFRRITVMGVLNSETEFSGAEKTAWGADSVFYIIDSGEAVITISGKPDADSKAVLRGGSGRRVISILGDSCIRFENILITGGDTEDEGGGIYAADGANIILARGAVVSGNLSSEGGGVYIEGGFFSMTHDAAVVDNAVSTDEGGGVVIMSGIFTMLDDSIIGGNAGGGLILANGEANMDGNAAIVDNVCEFYGGGVMAYASNFTMHGNSQISANKAGEDGGGIYLESGMLALLDSASISENEAGGDGGGINLEDASMVVQGYAMIAANKAGENGGGIHCQGGNVVLSEYASLLNNEAPCGGGLCIENYSSAIVRDEAAVSGNRAFGHHQGGGGLCAGYNSSIHMLGGEVFDNASDRGGGVYLEAASLILDAGYITGNRANAGGGIYAIADSLLKITDDSFVYDNSPDNIEQN